MIELNYEQQERVKKVLKDNDSPYSVDDVENMLENILDGNLEGDAEMALEALENLDIEPTV